MKKNLFLLLSVYFFVAQPVIAGFLRDDLNFFYLAGINIILIIGISRLYFSAQKDGKTEVEKTVADCKRETVVHTETTKTTKTNKRISPRKKKLSFAGATLLKWLIFSVSLVWIVITALYLKQMFAEVFSWFLGVLSGYVWFLVLSSIFMFRNQNTFFKGYRYLLLLWSVILWGLLLYTDFQSSGSYIKDFYSQTRNYLTSLWEKKDRPVSEVSTGTVLDVVISSGSSIFGDTVSWAVSLWEELNKWEITGDSGSGDHTIMEVPVIDTQVLQTVQDILPDVQSGQSLTILQWIRYLLRSNSIVLDTTKNIKFTYVSYDSEEYPYFKTAYKKRLIGKNTKPDALLSCDIYMVMKGLIAWWEVGVYSDIKTTYWNIAIAHDALNGCQRGGDVTPETL